MRKISLSPWLGGMGSFRLFPRLGTLAVALGALLASVPPTTAQANQKNVLILSGGRGRVSINLMESSLRSHFAGPVNFSIVDLENPRFEQKAYQHNLAEAIRAGYSGEKLDLVVAVMTIALQFAVQYRDKLFPGVPIVFMSNISPLPEKVWPGVTGVESTSGVRETIDLALRLHPDTQAVAVLSKPSGPENDWFQEEHAELLRHQDKVREIDLLGPATPELLQRVAELPPHTVVLFQLYPEDADQPAFGALDVLAAVTERFPTYSILPHLTVGHGGVGGASYDPAIDPVLAGELAARVLSGQRVDDIPVVQNSEAVVSVDWRQLRRWNIPESALPPGVRVLFREPTLWEQGRKYFLTAIAVILLQSFLIFGLFWQRSRRRKAETERRKSEEKFAMAFRESPLAISIVNLKDGHYVEVNDTFEVQTGWKRDEAIGRTPLEINLWVHPDQRTAFTRELQEKGTVRDLEVKLRRRDGQIRTSLGSAEIIEVHGEPCVLSVFADISERKLAEEAMSSFSRRLIEAQEAERTRIARELHDDINQRLAMVAVGLKMLKQDFSHSEPRTIRHIDATCEQVSGLEKDIQALSHRLHSSKLEYLGLEAAIASFCRELSERQNIKINLHSHGVPEDLSNEVSLCLFRVLQEALHNAVKYSGTDDFEVSLIGASHELRLRVHDSGAGFDPKTVRDGHGLGLTSMRERLRLVEGELSIDSMPKQGTTIVARVPLAHDTTPAGTAA
ncbi:MAG TPA: PAS domain S-box protein [Candidatus Sulfotelmatobacter sp.]|nr:PAS domain S-box protein [Candidatus Sulfotelmatobacter sp.]